jgi:hypothetical protein
LVTVVVMVVSVSVVAAGAGDHARRLDLSCRFLADSRTG